MTWEYTPRQLAAYSELAYRRRLGVLSELFSVIQVGAQGDAKAAKALMRKLNEESQ